MDVNIDEIKQIKQIKKFLLYVNIILNPKIESIFIDLMMNIYKDYDIKKIKLLIDKLLEIDKDKNMIDFHMIFYIIISSSINIDLFKEIINFADKYNMDYNFQLPKNKNKKSHYKNDEGMNILMHIIEYSKDINIEIIKLLLTKNINLNIVNSEGYSALHYACLEKNYEIVYLLVNHHNSYGPINIGIQNENGYTALHYCSEKYIMLKILLDKLDNINVVNSPINLTTTNLYPPFMSIISIDTMKLFLEDPYININLKNMEGVTTLNYITNSIIQLKILTEFNELLNLTSLI
jgi:ankyrin repeat protein